MSRKARTPKSKSPWVRTRGTGLTSGGYVVGQQWNWNSSTNAWVLSNANFSNHNTWDEEIFTQDVVTPGYADLQKQGAIINNAYRHAEVNVESTPCTRYQISDAGVNITMWTNQCFTWNPGAVNAPDYTTQYSRALNAASAVAWGGVEKPQVDGLVSIGELGENLQMFSDLCKGGLALLTKLEQIKARASKMSAREHASALNNAYLTFTYGIKPLLRDIDNISAACRSGESPYRRTSRGFGSFSATWDQTVTSFLDHTVTAHFAQMVDVRAFVLYDTIPPKTTMERFNRKWGMRMSDIPVAAYQLYPYSFVADMYSNLGNMLRSYVNIVGNNGASPTRILTSGYTVHETLTGYCDAAKTRPASMCSIGGLHSSFTRQTKTRTPGLPYPSLSWKPNLWNDLVIQGVGGRTGQAVINTASLIAQRLLTHKPSMATPPTGNPARAS